MATEAQLKLLLETVEKQKADIEAKEQIIIDRNKELALLQQDFQDRDRHSRDFIKEQEEKFKLIIRELEDKLKATSLSGGTASTRAIGSAQLVTSRTSPATATPASTDLATAVQHFRRSHRSPGVYKMRDDIESFISRYECYCKMEYINESEKAGNLMLAMDPKIYPVIDRELTADEKNEMCCDIRRLNDATRKDSYPLPRINKIINTVSGAKLFSTMECWSEYHQLALKH
jgi:hypothetical protein